MLALMLVLLLSPAESQQDVTCDQWQLFGYHIGMDKPSAFAVRDAPMKKLNYYKTKEKGVFDGTIRFDDGGVVVVVARYKGAEGADELVNQESKLLGSSTFDVLDDPFKAELSDRTIGWESRACDTAVYIEEEHFGTARTTVQLYLVRLSMLENAVGGGPVRKLPGWLEE